MFQFREGVFWSCRHYDSNKISWSLPYEKTHSVWCFREKSFQRPHRLEWLFHSCVFIHLNTWTRQYLEESEVKPKGWEIALYCIAFSTSSCKRCVNLKRLLHALVKCQSPSHAKQAIAAKDDNSLSLKMGHFILTLMCFNKDVIDMSNATPFLPIYNPVRP